MSEGLLHDYSFNNVFLPYGLVSVLVSIPDWFCRTLVQQSMFRHWRTQTKKPLCDRALATQQECYMSHLIYHNHTGFMKSCGQAKHVVIPLIKVSHYSVSELVAQVYTLYLDIGYTFKVYLYHMPNR